MKTKEEIFNEIDRKIHSGDVYDIPFRGVGVYLRHILGTLLDIKEELVAIYFKKK